MTQKVTVNVPALRRLTTAHELRDATIRDYLAAAARAGIAVDRAALERQAVADCEVADAFRRAHPIAPRVTQTADDVRARKANMSQDLAEQGVSLVDASQVQRQSVDGWHTVPADERARLRNGRVARITSGAVPHTDPAVAFSTCECPHLAYALYRIKADFTASFFWKPRPGDEPNDFFGMSIEDKGRMMVRKVEDVCDLSTGRLGPWRVPK